MQSAAAEARSFACGVESLQRRSVRRQHAAGEIRLQSAQRLARQDVQLDPDQRPGRRVQHPVRRRGARPAVAAIAPAVVNALNLRVLGVGIGHLGVAILDLGADQGWVEQWLLGQAVHLPDQCLQIVGDHEVGALVAEGGDFPRRGLAQARTQDA